MRYDYELINERNHPIIKGTIVGPSGNEELIMMVDTGFEGYLLIEVSRDMLDRCDINGTLPT